MKELLVPPSKKENKNTGKKTYRKFKMPSLNKFRSAELTDSNCILVLHDCADHLGDADRKRCKREGLAERGGGAGGGGGRWGQLPPEQKECVIMEARASFPSSHAHEHIMQFLLSAKMLAPSWLCR